MASKPTLPLVLDDDGELLVLGHLYLNFPKVERDIDQDVALLEAAIAEWLAEADSE
jgi:hypothetical protein